jgi:hypothetical protein
MTVKARAGRSVFGVFAIIEENIVEENMDWTLSDFIETFERPPEVARAATDDDA